MATTTFRIDLDYPLDPRERRIFMLHLSHIVNEITLKRPSRTNPPTRTPFAEHSKLTVKVRTNRLHIKKPGSIWQRCFKMLAQAEAFVDHYLVHCAGCYVDSAKGEGTYIEFEVEEP